MGEFAQTHLSFCPAFSKAGARRVGEKNGIFFLQSFFVFGFAKQIADVSQARKEVPLVAKEKASNKF